MSEYPNSDRIRLEQVLKLIILVLFTETQKANKGSRTFQGGAVSVEAKRVRTQECQKDETLDMFLKSVYITLFYE